MKNRTTLLCLLLAFVLCVSFPAARAQQDRQSQDHPDQEVNGNGGKDAPLAVVLQSVLTGLFRPVLVTHAHDGTNRLFILEQDGHIRVLQPGSSTTTVFLDLTAKVSYDGGERGLLGLAFHPQYPVNGRFFVYYTMKSDGTFADGTIRVAEYRVSSGDPNVANTAETALLSIPHPTNANHNGGNMAFGPDGYLYMGTGDGGSGNDPPNNAQNINSLLGKILRIDIDHPNGAIPYSSPPDNPFFGATPGADEIYTYGMRNPWRWSFDRGGTHQLYCADVGQGAFEEIDILTLGGNYGWRVFEGFHCTGNDPTLCNASSLCNISGYTCPIFEYNHSAGRCSITGGFIYRGARSTVPTGVFVFADYCTGEIWQVNPASPPVPPALPPLLIDTPLNVTSFGDDEAGEIYVVGQGGTVDRLTLSPSPPACSFAISPSNLLLPAIGAGASLTLTSTSDCAWLAAPNVSWITLATTSGAGGGTISFTLADNFTGAPRAAKINVAGKTLNIVQDSTAAPDCTYGINPASMSFSNAGGSAFINLFAPERCAWQAVASDPWITITSSPVGIGSNMVNFSVAPNLSGKARKGTITIAGQVFRIKQKP
jgi:glucose/arabinose dehydrogenase